MDLSHDLGKNVAISDSSIYVVELNDDYTAKYDEVYQLTTANAYEANGSIARELNEGNTNEAPYMVWQLASWICGNSLWD